LSFVIICYNFWLNNAYYQKADYITENTKSFETRLLGRFEQLEGFTLDTKFAVIADNLNFYGKNIQEVRAILPHIKNDQGFYGYNVIGLRDQVSASFKTKMLMRNFLGIELDTASPEETEEIIKTDEYKSMGVYPAYDSVKMINGIAVVNFRADTSEE